MNDSVNKIKYHTEPEEKFEIKTKNSSIFQATKDFTGEISKLINETSIHRLLLTITLIGYIVIAFSGNMNNLYGVLRYSIFILFSLFLCFILYNKRKYDLYIETLFKVIILSLLLIPIIFAVLTITNIIGYNF